jgi:carbonic anhydrase/acetyltransferase-like protein (isoleucine patch superfamily)
VRSTGTRLAIGGPVSVGFEAEGGTVGGYGRPVPIYALGDLAPSIDPDAYVHPDAVVIGDVRLGPFASVWPGAVLRGDSSWIEVGARTSIQDGTVIHCSEGEPTIVGADCVVGHVVHLEGCTIGDGTLIGSGSIVLNNARVGTHALIGANAVVSNGVVVPSGARALGVPARITEDAVPPGAFAHAVDHYVHRGARYKRELRRLE